MTTIDGDGTIRHTRGDSLAITLYDILINGATESWTGWKARFVLKRSPTGEELLSLDETDGVDLTTNGQISIAKIDMSDIGIGEYVYDIEMTNPTDFVSTWMENRPFIVSQDVAQ